MSLMSIKISMGLAIEKTLNQDESYEHRSNPKKRKEVQKV